MSNGWWFMSEGERIVWQGRPRLSAAFPGVSVGTIICLLAMEQGYSWTFDSPLSGFLGSELRHGPYCECVEPRTWSRRERCGSNRAWSDELFDGSA